MRVIVRDESGFPLKDVEEDLTRDGISLDVQALLSADSRSEEWLDWLAWHLAWSKVRRPDRPIPPDLAPAQLEVDRERAALEGRGRPPGPLYDGVRMMEAFHGPLPASEQRFDAGPVVVLTDRLIGTFEGSRYHVRFLVGGHPTIVSVPGLIDGPARDRGFYVAKQFLGSDIDFLSSDDHLTRHDPRLATCVASALLQAVEYHRTGDPFCAEPTCRLFNPHWQREILASMAKARTCAVHADRSTS